MEKNYTNSVSKPLQPSPKTLQTILNYSKAYALLKCKSLEFDFNQN
jgi:hypothetical protein